MYATFSPTAQQHGARAPVATALARVLPVVPLSLMPALLATRRVLLPVC